MRHYTNVAYGNGTFVAVGIATILQSDPVTTPLPQTFMLTISKSGTGNGMVKSSDGKIDCGTDCSEVYNSGSVVTLTATPDANSIFVGWGSNCVGTGSCSITVNADTTITSNFTLSSSLPQQRTLTVTKTGTGNGTITATGLSYNGNAYVGEYASGTVVTLTAQADTWSTFDGWSGGGCTGKEACTITLNENTSLTASFLPQGLQGTPKISVSPVLANLGSVRVGSASNPKTVIIKNTGTSDLTINSITFTGANLSEFTQTNNCTTIQKGSSCPVTLTLAPTLPFGKKNAVMSIASNDPKKSTVNVKLSGQAPPPKISASPMSVNLGSIPVGGTSLPKIITVKNTGTSDLVVNSITITGVNASEFSQTSDCTTVPCRQNFQTL